MKPFLFSVMAVMFLASGWALFAQTQKRRPPGPPEKAEVNGKPNIVAFMRLKLDHSQKILEGVVLEDFASIKQHAQMLGSLALDENWRVLQTREYRDYSAEFQQIAVRLSKTADDKNVDAAALGYLQLTLTCVNCHKHVREQIEGKR